MLAHHEDLERDTATEHTLIGGLDATQVLGPGESPGRVRASAGKPTSRRVWEQRRNVRYPCELDVRCQGEESDAAACWTAKARNVSIGGIRLLTGRRIEQGTVFEIELPCPARGEAIRLVAQVVHMAATRYGAWVLGCAFERRLTTEELHDLIG